MRHWDMRLAEQAIEDGEELEALLREAKYVTVAMCHEGEPYLVSLTHGYDGEKRAIYFHCAREGKKVDILKTNAVVWCQAVVDGGVEPSQCRQHFSSVQFRGTVTFLEDLEEKRHALAVLLRQFGRDVDGFFDKEDAEDRVRRVNIGRIDMGEMTGKRSP